MFNRNTDEEALLVRKILPEKYAGNNCFLNMIDDAQLRQRVYEEIKSNPDNYIIYKESSSFAIKNLDIAAKAYNKIAGKDQMASYSLGHENFVKLILNYPDLELGFITTVGQDRHHAQKLRLGSIRLDSEPWFEKGNEFLKNGHYTEAIKCYDKALSLEPLDARALANKALALSHLKEYEKALEFYDKALQIIPRRVEIWFCKALTFHNLKRYGESAQCWDKILEIEPKRADAWWNKANALMFLDSTEKTANALIYMKLALKLEPNIFQAWPWESSDKQKMMNMLSEESYGEEYAYKLLTESSSYLRKLEGEDERTFARKWTIICLGFYNRALELAFAFDKEGWKAGRLLLYNEVICKIMSEPFQNYENSCTKGFHLTTSNTNYRLGRFIGELIPDDEYEIEKTVSTLAESILPGILPIWPDIRSESKNDDKYGEKVGDSTIKVVSYLFNQSVELSEKGKYLEAQIADKLRKIMIREYGIDNLALDLISEDDNTWKTAVNALVYLGNENGWGDVVIEHILEALRNNINHKNASSIRVALGRIGKPAIQPLIEAFKDANEEVTISICSIFKLIGQPAVQPLIGLLKDKDKQVRQSAALALISIGKPSIMLLSNLLRDENELLRQYAETCIALIEKNINE